MITNKTNMIWNVGETVIVLTTKYGNGGEKL